MKDIPVWIDIVIKITPAFVTLVIGAVASTIAFFQFRIARDKLKLDLFSRRREAYEKLIEFFTMVGRDGTVTDLTIPLISEARYKAQFLFGDEIMVTFESLFKKSLEVKTLNNLIFGSCAFPVGPERTAACESHKKLVDSILDDMKYLPTRYSKYLKIL